MNMKKGLLFLSLILPILLLAGCGSGSSSSSISGNIVKAVDFNIQSIDGENIKLSDYSANDRPVLLYFFATWCPNCARDLSALQKVYPEFEDKVSLIAIDVDPQESKFQINAYKQKYPGLSNGVFATANSNVLSRYNVRYTTTKYAINREGNVIFSNSGIVTLGKWRSILEELAK